MKRLILEMSGFVVVACLLTVVFYSVVGEPDRTVKCITEDLEPYHVCVATVAADWGGDVQWVDARTRSDWERSGMDGSVLLTDDPKEDFNELIATSMEAIFMASQLEKKVVIYCNGESCGSSKAVHAKLMEQGIYDEIYILHGGWRALSQELKRKESSLYQGS